ncbi:hypothetical protein ACH5RR_029541 [Cinchona calisaya]|uniref:Uncharacterized protein n=1 Tax=Cinchona calisaya TaxID=153742 RepID=A0ABD2YRX4_9GENT
MEPFISALNIDDDGVRSRVSLPRTSPVTAISTLDNGDFILLWGRQFSPPLVTFLQLVVSLSGSNQVVVIEMTPNLVLCKLNWAAPYPEG